VLVEELLMSRWYTRWFGYGLGAGVAKALFGDAQPEGGGNAHGPIRTQTEAEIRADEKRYAEDARRLDAEDAATKRRDTRG
jgi:hypothetical protein